MSWYRVLLVPTNAEDNCSFLFSIIARRKEMASAVSGAPACSRWGPNFGGVVKISRNLIFYQSLSSSLHHFNYIKSLGSHLDALHSTTSIPSWLLNSCLRLLTRLTYCSVLLIHKLLTRWVSCLGSRKAPQENHGLPS